MPMTYGNRPANGTEGDYMRAQTCASCTVDHDGGWHDDIGPQDDSCPILAAALFGEHSYGTDSPGPPEWGHDLDTGETDHSAHIGLGHGTDCEGCQDLAVAKAARIVALAGWRIVRTQELVAGYVYLDERDDNVEITEEWTPDA